MVKSDFSQTDFTLYTCLVTLQALRGKKLRDKTFFVISLGLKTVYLYSIHHIQVQGPNNCLKKCQNFTNSFVAFSPSKKIVKPSEDQDTHGQNWPLKGGKSRNQVICDQKLVQSSWK